MSLREAAKGFGGRSKRWDDPIKDEYFKPGPRMTTVRLYPDTTNIHTHWVEFTSKDGKKTGLVRMCLNFDVAKQERVDGGCPYCENGFKASVSTHGYCFDRRRALKNNLIVQPIRMTKTLCDDILSLSEVVYPDLPGDSAPDATDADGGFDVNLKEENVNSKVTYKATQGERSALSDDEIQALADYKAEGKDIRKLAAARNARETREEALDFLHSRGLVGGGKKSSASAPPARRPRDDADDEVPAARPQGRRTALDDDDEVPAKPTRRPAPPADDDDDAPPPAKKPEKRQSLSSDDDDDDDAPPPPAKKPTQRTYSRPDADDVPEDDE